MQRTFYEPGFCSLRASSHPQRKQGVTVSRTRTLPFYLQDFRTTSFQDLADKLGGGACGWTFAQVVHRTLFGGRHEQGGRLGPPAVGAQHRVRG